jgi:hypothetical protein
VMYPHHPSRFSSPCLIVSFWTAFFSFISYTSLFFLTSFSSPSDSNLISYDLHP